MLKIRLQRIGRKNDASFRVVVTDSRQGPKAGRHVDILGSYDPKQDRFEVDATKVKDRMAHGAQVSDTVRNLLISKGILEGRKVNVLPRKSPIIDPEKIKAEAEAKAKAEAAAAALAAAAEVVEETPAASEEESVVTEEAPAAEEQQAE